MTLNLATGKQYTPRPEDYCTKVAGTHCDHDMRTPIWDEFLDRVTDGNEHLQAYLKRVVGYCCSGLTSEHCLFFSLRHWR